jgi:hypothetical protein
VFDSLPTLIAIACALLDAGEDAEASTYAHEALATARDADHGVYATYAEWLLRRLAYQQALPLDPDLELVRATESLRNPAWAGLVLLIEAAFAWRLNQTLLARSWARRAAQLLDAARHDPGAILAWALATQLGEPSTLVERAQLLVRASKNQMPGVELQVLALTGGDPSLVAQARRRARSVLAELAIAPERVDFSRRLELLSPAECASRLGLSLPQSQTP